MRRSSSVVLAAALAVVLLGGCSGGGGGDGGSNGTVSFTANGYLVNEDGSVIDTITVQRVGGSGDVSVTVTFTDGTASSPADYDDTPIVLVWLSGDFTDKTFAVPIVDDNNDEADETLTMHLGSTTGGLGIGSPGNATLTIIDEDIAGTVQFDASTYTYNEDGTDNGLPITVTRTGGMDGDITVTVLSFDGTANSDVNSQVEPQDYSPVSFLVMFADQSTTPVVVSINIVQDLLPELDEDLTLALTNPTNGALIGSPSTATLTITDDDDTLEIEGLQINEFFGSVVAKLGARLVVGAPGLNNGAGGFATVEFNGPSVDKLYFPAPPFGEGVGKALSVNGLEVLVGGLSNAYLYDNPVFGNNSPVLSILNALDGFGCSVYLNSSRIIVGAPDANGGAGAVRVYTHGGSFLEQVDGRAGELFGTSLAPAGSSFGVGAPGNEGSVQFFEVGNGNLNLVIDNPFPGGGPGTPSFGEAVAVDLASGFIFVGAPEENTLANADGRVYRFDGLTINSLLAPGAPTAQGRFGATIFVSSTGVLCVQQQGGAMGTGRVYCFDLSGNLLQTFDAPVAAPLGDFGASMCEFDGALVIGAPKIPALVQQGRVFMFRLPIVP